MLYTRLFDAELMKPTKLHEDSNVIKDTTNTTKVSLVATEPFIPEFVLKNGTQNETNKVNSFRVTRELSIRRTGIQQFVSSCK